jgi:hypothetical protein
MLPDQGEHHLLVCLQGFDWYSFIFPHHPAIPGHIGTEDGSQLELETLRVREITS